MLGARQDQRALVSRYFVDLSAVESRKQELENNKPFQIDKGPKQMGLLVSLGGTSLFATLTLFEKLANRKKSKELLPKNPGE